MAYCHAAGYGDYEHGAFWFGLEPRAAAFAARADVLFLGDSRMQHAFSTSATAAWFSSSAARYYLLGFGYSENSAFAAALLAHLKPQAKLYVINMDRFFDRRETIPARTVIEDDGARLHYQIKRLWQLVHRPICEHVPMVCGDQYVVFRSREDGTYHPSGLSALESKPVTYAPASEGDNTENDITIARAFLSRLQVKHDCVILTLVPTVATKGAGAAEMAAVLGLEFVSPKLDNLTTFDGSHLDHASAERWSAAFLQVAAPRIRDCLRQSTAAQS